MHSRTTVHELSCGIPLLMHENHDVAVATADVWVRTGSADEPPEIAGISHFLEHMLFKGTKSWGLGEIEREIEMVGGSCNAGTSRDFTHYYVTLPAPAIETGIRALAEMVRCATLDPKELEKERQVILEEYRRKQDHPVGVLYEQLYSEFFETGPYHETIIGSEQTIRGITREAMFDYYEKRYSPANSALVVTGHIDPDQIVRLAEDAFAGWDRPLAVLRPTPPVTMARGKLRHIEKTTGGEVYVAFVLPAPGTARRDQVIPLDMTEFILARGRAAVLFQSIKEKRGLCSSIGGFYPAHRHDSLFVVIATCMPEQRADLRKALAEELNRFAEGEPAANQFRRGQRLLGNAHLFSTETTGGASTTIGYYYTMTGGPDFFDNYMDELQLVTPARVHQATRAIVPEGELTDALVEVSVGPAGNGVAQA